MRLQNDEKLGLKCKFTWFFLYSHCKIFVNGSHHTPGIFQGFRRFSPKIGEAGSNDREFGAVLLQCPWRFGFGSLIGKRSRGSSFCTVLVACVVFCCSRWNWTVDKNLELLDPSSTTLRTQDKYRKKLPSNWFPLGFLFQKLLYRTNRGRSNVEEKCDGWFCKIVKQLYFNKMRFRFFSSRMVALKFFFSWQL